MSKLTKNSRFILLLYQKFKYITYKALAAVLDPEVIETNGRTAFSLTTESGRTVTSGPETSNKGLNKTSCKFYISCILGSKRQITATEKNVFFSLSRVFPIWGVEWDKEYQNTILQSE